MKLTSLLIILLSVPLFTNGQIKNFYDLDNSFHEIYKNAKVKSIMVYSKEYYKGFLVDDYLEIVQKLDTEGNIIEEREYFDADTTDGWIVKYKYNDQHQTVKTDWTWLEDNEQEVSEYEYNAKGQLIRNCDYTRASGELRFTLDSCMTFQYKNNKLIEVYSKNKRINYYKEVDGIVHEYSDSGELESKYEKGEIIYLKVDSTSYEYKNNSVGQILESIEKDAQGNMLSKTVFEYTNGLLKKVTSRDNLGKYIFREEYVYEFFD